MNSFVQKQRQWLLPATLILFILLVVTFPFVAQITYSGRSESPDHVLTYVPGELVWGSETGINADGAAELSLFSAKYDNVLSADGDKVIAPGTNGINIVRLKNSAGGAVTYTATVYRIRSTETLPVSVSLDGRNFTDTTRAVLPEGVPADSVIRSVTGSVGSGEIQDFDISWLWLFTEGEAQDIADTGLGDKAAAGYPDDVTVGIYIVIEDNNETIQPEIPTGDNNMIGMYIVLMAVSGFFMFFLLFGRKREKDEEEEQCSESR